MVAIVVVAGGAVGIKVVGSCGGCWLDGAWVSGVSASGSGAADVSAGIVVPLGVVVAGSALVVSCGR